VVAWWTILQHVHTNVMQLLVFDVCGLEVTAISRLHENNGVISNFHFISYVKRPKQVYLGLTTHDG